MTDTTRPVVIGERTGPLPVTDPKRGGRHRVEVPSRRWTWPWSRP